MRKYKSENGFTLSELLIVVDIIAILVAIAIPVFTFQLKKARLAVDEANIREAYSLMQYAKITEEITIDGTTKTLSDCISKGSFSGFLYFTNGATLSTRVENAYQLKETDPDCKQLPERSDIGDKIYNDGHQKDNHILLWIHGEIASPSIDMLGVPF